MVVLILVFSYQTSLVIFMGHLHWDVQSKQPKIVNFDFIGLGYVKTMAVVANV